MTFIAYNLWERNKQNNVPAQSRLKLNTGAKLQTGLGGKGAGEGGGAVSWNFLDLSLRFNDTE